MTVKRLFDLVVGSLLCGLLSPLLLGTAVVVRVCLGSPVLFTQMRTGLHGRPFRMIKFRTMMNLQDVDGTQPPDDQRLTRVGRFLRAFSLDELPELVNVLRGEMSLVGPRPLLPEYLPLYTPAQARRHDVQPGMAGWAQVNGRNALSWDQKFVLDLWYVDHRSLWLDLRILLLAVPNVFRRAGISSKGHATMPPFEGERNGRL